MVAPAEVDSASCPPHSDASPSACEVARSLAIGLTTMIGALTLIGIALTSMGPLSAVREWDESISRRAVVSRTRARVDAARFISELGDTRPILLLLAVTTVVVLVTRQWRALVFVPLAMLAEISTFVAVNYAVGRPRPTVDKIGPIPSTSSFPSGHIAATLVCWVAPAILLYSFGHRRIGQALAAAGALAAVAMGWARVYLGMHHVLDVVLGLMMGSGAIAIAIRATALPFVPPHGIGATGAQTAAPARSPSMTAA